jgi:hypothetical protein
MADVSSRGTALYMMQAKHKSLWIGIGQAIGSPTSPCEEVWPSASKTSHSMQHEMQHDDAEAVGQLDFDDSLNMTVVDDTPLCAQLKLMLMSPVFVCVVLALSALYFVVTGIQFWATRYLLVVIGADYGTIVVSFALVTVTAPVVGVVFGGWVIDQKGGYQGDQGMATTTKYCFFFSLMATSFAIPSGYIFNLPMVLTFVWMILFWGAAIMPGATGLVLVSVPPQSRAFSCAMAMLVYNIFGYTAGSVVPGIFMQFWKFDMLEIEDEQGIVWRVEDEQAELKFGMRLVLNWCVLGCIFLGLATYFAHQKLKKSEVDDRRAASIIDHDFNEIHFDELMNEQTAVSL